MKTSRYLFPILFILHLSCQKWDFEQRDFLIVTTGEVSNLQFLSTQVEGEIAGLRNGLVSQHGHIWSETVAAPELPDEDIGRTAFDQRPNGRFFSTVTGLKMNTRYHYRAYATFEGKTTYGAVRDFTTKNLLIAVDTVIGAPDGEITAIGIIEGPSIAISEALELRLPITDHGFVWSGKNDAPALEDSPFLGLGPLVEYGRFQTPINGLEKEQNYYLRSYLIIESVDTIYGKVYHFHTFPSPVGWKRIPDFPGQERVYAFGFSLDGKGYFGGGYPANAWLRGEDAFALEDFWIFDPLTNGWANPGTLPGGSRAGAVSFTLGSKGYIASGYPEIVGNNLVFLNDVWEFTTARGWQRSVTLENFKAGITTLFPDLSFSLNGKGYFINGGESSMWEFDPNKGDEGALRQLAQLPFDNSPCFFIPIETEGIAYCWSGTGNALWQFDPNAGSKGIWIPKGVETFPGETVNFSLYLTTGNKGYFGLNIIRTGSHTTLLPQLWEFDPQAMPGERWKRMPDYPGNYSPRTSTDFTGGMELAIDGKCYIGIGTTVEGQPTRELWEFTPSR